MSQLSCACRSLLKTPIVTTVAVLSVALGIGANVAIFSVFNQTLLRLLPVPEPPRLVNLVSPGPRSGSVSCGSAGTCDSIFSYPMFRDLERVQTSFTGIAAHRDFGASIAYGGTSEGGDAALVSGSYFSVLGLTPHLVTDFFNANRAQFNLAEESYHLAQIVVTPVREGQLTNTTGDDAATPQAAAAKVQMLMERLTAGAPFQDLAAGYSEDPESAPRGGDLGMVPLSRLKQVPPQLRDAVLNKAPGTVNVASGGGAYTLVLVVAREPAGQRDLSTPGVRDRITETLRSRKEQLFRSAYLTVARADAKVVNHLARRLVESTGTMPGLQLSAPGAK